jgi:hypothetical protein
MSDGPNTFIVATGRCPTGRTPSSSPPATETW